MKTAAEWMDQRLALTIAREQATKWVYFFEEKKVEVIEIMRHYARRLQRIDGGERRVCVLAIIPKSLWHKWIQDIKKAG